MPIDGGKQKHLSSISSGNSWSDYDNVCHFAAVMITVMSTSSARTCTSYGTRTRLSSFHCLLLDAAALLLCAGCREKLVLDKSLNWHETIYMLCTWTSYVVLISWLFKKRAIQHLTSIFRWHSISRRSIGFNKKIHSFIQRSNFDNLYEHNSNEV